MVKKINRNGVTRRGFLKLAGAAAGLLATPSALLGLDRQGDNAAGLFLPSLKVGVLLPKSGIYPALSENFMAGMQLSLDCSGAAAGRIRFVNEDAGASLPVGGLRRLLEKEDIDLAVCLVNSGTAALLGNALPDVSVPMIAGNVGECMVRAADHAPSIFHCTLNNWQANWAMGSWAARHLGKRANIAASLYDSGYDGIYAFRLGFESSGGEIVGTQVSHNGPGTSDLRQVIRGISGSGTDLVFALYCGAEAEAFIRAYASSGLSGNIPLIGTAFLTDESVLKRVGQAAAGIKTSLSWSVSLPTPENRKFVEKFRAKTGRGPDVFAVLGYETAGLLASALKSAGGSGPARLIKGLGSARFEGPRGLLQMDPGTNTVHSPLYLAEVKVSQDGPVNTIISNIDSVSELDERVETLRAAVRSGWHSPYLCA